jgi:hypothetical protein
MKHFNGTLNFHFIGNKYEFASSLRLLFVKKICCLNRSKKSINKEDDEEEDVEEMMG